MKEIKGIEEKILDRALYLFGKNGSTNVSIRTIVKEAEVNVSAINYYFGSKDNMLKYVKQFYIDNITQAYSPLDYEELSNEERLIRCANEIIEYSLRYPGVLVMNKEATDSKEQDERDVKIIETTKEKNRKLDSTLIEVLNCEGEEVKYKRAIFISSIIYPFMGEDHEFFGEEISNNIDSRLNYIKYILKMLKGNDMKM